MPKEPRTTPRVVCVSIPMATRQGKVLLITSRKKQERWCLPKGGWETMDITLENAASREALEEAGVRGVITRFVVTIPTQSCIYHFFEMEVTQLEDEWLERKERTRAWVDFPEAIQRLSWKPELVQGMMLSTFARR